MGQVFTDDRISEFVSAVNSGGVGMFGLQLSTDMQTFEIESLSVSSGQDVRIFSTATDSMLTFAEDAPLTVVDGGSLTISGTIALPSRDLMVTLVADGVSLGRQVTVTDGAALMDLTKAPLGTFTVAIDGQTAGALVQDDNGALVGTGSFGSMIYMTTVADWASSNTGGTISACLVADVPSAVGGTPTQGGSPTVYITFIGELTMDCVKPGGTTPLCTMRDRLEITVEGAVATLRHLRFADLSCPGSRYNSHNPYGGAIYLSEGGELDAFHCAFEGNHAPGGMGGAITIEGGGSHTAPTLFLSGCNFTSNIAQNGGAPLPQMRA